MAIMVPAALAGGTVADIIRQQGMQNTDEAILLGKNAAGTLTEADRHAIAEIAQRLYA